MNIQYDESIELVYRFYNDSEEVFAALARGEVDMTGNLRAFFGSTHPQLVTSRRGLSLSTRAGRRSLRPLARIRLRH